MAGAHCAVCGREEFLPFRCKLCGAPHCLDHRLPENHACPHLAEYKGRAREERAAAGRDEPGRVRVRRPMPWSGAADAVSRFARRSATHLLLAAILVLFGLQVVGALAIAAGTGAGLLGAWNVVGCAMALGECGPFTEGPFGLLSKPWSVATNLFAHDNFLHIFFNALFLYFFGLELESRIGRRAFLQLFLAGGALAAFGQVGLFDVPVLGASGGLMAVLGTLTVLAPTMRVVIFIVPAPLWALTLLFVVLDFAGFFDPGSAGIANLAHLLGLAVGLAYGLRLKRRGVVPRVASTWASQRRF